MWFARALAVVRGGGAHRTLVRLLAAALVFAVMTPPPASVRATASAQGLPDDDLGFATVGLSHYLFTDKTRPAGYSLTTTVAYPNDAEAFDAGMVPPTDPRPIETLFSHLNDAGRLLRLRQDLDNDDDSSAPELRYAIVLFTSPEAAAQSLKDPSVLDFVLPDATVGPLTVPSLGDASAGFSIDETRDPDVGPERAVLMAWQHGRVVLTASAVGSHDAADAALPSVIDLANRAEQNIGSYEIGAMRRSPPKNAYLPSADKRLALYQDAADRTLADDAMGNSMTSAGVSAIPNELLILDSQRNVPSSSDIVVAYDAVLHRERHILGVSKEFDQANADPSSPISQYPSVSVGYHLYADVDGVTNALDDTPPWIALRVNEEITLLNDPSQQQLEQATSIRRWGDSTRTLTGHVTLADGSQVDLTTVRWRRGATELFVDIAVPASTSSNDVRALALRTVEQLDAIYTSNPIKASE